MNHILQQAVHNGDLITIHNLLTIHPELINGPSVSPLMWASFYGYTNIVKFLLSRNADPNHLDDKDGNALHAVCTAGHINIFEMLIKAGANPTQRTVYGYSPLITASQWGHLELVKLLICIEGVNINECDNKGNTACHWATYHNHIIVVHYLLNQGVNPEIQCHNGLTPIDIAKYKKNSICIRLLQKFKKTRHRELQRCMILKNCRDIYNHISFIKYNYIQYGKKPDIITTIKSENLIDKILECIPLYREKKEKKIAVMKYVTTKLNNDLFNELIEYLKPI